MYLGLDLRGGVHFLLQVDMKAALKKRPFATRTISAPNCAPTKSATAASPAKAMSSACISTRVTSATPRSTNWAPCLPSWLFTPEDQAEGFSLTARLKPETEIKVQEFALQQNITTLRNRVNELGVAEPIIQQQGADRVVVQLPGVQDTAKAKDILGRTATLEIRMVDETGRPIGEAGAKRRSATKSFPAAKAATSLVKKDVVLTGDSITDASPGFDSTSGQAAVHINLDGTGARIFKEVTRENVGKRMAILLIEKARPKSSPRR